MILIFLRGALAGMWMLLIFTMSAQVGSESAALSGSVADTVLSVLGFFQSDIREIIDVEQFESTLRTLAHFFLYFIFAIWVYNFLWSFFKDWFRLITESTMIALLVAILDETLQAQIPGRAMQLTDIYTDFFGALFGTMALTLVFYKLKRVT
jgi:VanZ family protein